MKRPWHSWALGAGAVGSALWLLLRRRAPGRRRIVAIGASLTKGGVYAKEVARLQGDGSIAVAYGWPGQGSRYIGERIGKALEQYPTDVIISALGNDIASGRKVSSIEKRHQAMYEAIKRYNSDTRIIVLLSPPRRSYGRWKPAWDTKLAEFAAWARRNPLVDAVVDPRSAMATGDGALKREYDAGDHLHPNAAGRRVMGREIYRQAFA